MKKLLVFLFVATAFAACKKNDDVTPKNPADAVAGTYALTSFRFVQGTDDLNLPQLPFSQAGQTISGTLELSPTSTDEVTLTVTLKITGEAPESFDIDGVEVRKSSEAYSLYVEGELVADADGQNVIFSYSETDPQTQETTSLSFVAKK
ncbi:hypothetical protein [Salmonirosea aquatica]|uniref:Lipocalin-like domain-containing protein n=1 Tax=Salmonirosea aquatica TaxID=2654236 RepID=A0A7C9BAA4_9BACT|nr:hypothetical protein [Cytophagaceae bacterium SJW1-29]